MKDWIKTNWFKLGVLVIFSYLVGALTTGHVYISVCQYEPESEFALAQILDSKCNNK